MRFSENFTARMLKVAAMEADSISVKKKTRESTLFLPLKILRKAHTRC